MSTPGVPGGALPFSGPLDLTAINTEFGLGTDLTQYHGVRWYYDGNLTTGLFGGSTINISDFRGKRATDPASAGTIWSNTSGSGSTVTPLYRNTITIEIWGAGGGGGGANGSDGAKGGDTSIVNYQPPSGGTFPSDYTAGGGKGGQNGTVPTPPPPLPTEAGNRGPRDSSGPYYSFQAQDVINAGGSSFVQSPQNVNQGVPSSVVGTSQSGGLFGGFGFSGINTTNPT